MYAVAKARTKQLERNLGRVIREVVVEYDYLSQQGLVDRVVVRKEDVRLVWPDVKAKAQRVYGATEFPAEPGEHCMLCPIRKVCQPDISITMDEFDAIFA